MKKNSKLHIPIETELKIKLENKARSLSISLSDFCRMVLINSLKAELIINQ
jgi:hypothetical protein